MLVEEARWIGTRLRAMPNELIYPMVNIGSATENFRTVEQPYIDAEIFAPARRAGGKVVHVDAKAAPGVDIIGDLCDEAFVAQLRKRQYASVMCCNLLEHVVERQKVCDAVASLVRPGGYIIVSVPYVFPYHEDPIDTMFRPDVEVIARLFPECSLCEGEIVRASWYAYELGSPNAAFRLGIRIAIPFYRPKNWWRTVCRSARMFYGYRVTCVILRRREG